MTLNFPNANRSYDSERNRVRFSGYDGMFQIDCAVEIDAIAGNRNPETEGSSLDAFGCCAGCNQRCSASILQEESAQPCGSDP